MARINTGKFVLGGLIASAICFVTDGFLHEKLLNVDWQAAFEASHADVPTHNPFHFVYFGLFEIGRGFIAMAVYVLLRDRWKPGAKTAGWAGLVSWFAFCFTGPAQFIPLGMFTDDLWIKAGFFQIVTSVVAAVAGAAPYKSRG